jgi:hypothetical protein
MDERDGLQHPMHQCLLDRNPEETRRLCEWYAGESNGYTDVALINESTVAITVTTIVSSCG